MSKKPELINYYDKIPKKYMGKKRKNPNYKYHGLNLPFRMIIVGASGSGKSNILLNVINFVSCFNNIVLVTKNADEPLYNWLKDKIKDDNFKIYEGIENIPDLDEFEKDDENLIIFDDMIVEKNQKKIEEYYTRCRKLGITAIYLSQSWYQIPIIIRQNVSYIIIKKFASNKDIKLILREQSLGMETSELNEIYEYCIDGSFTNFMMIDATAPSKQKFRKNFDILSIDFNDN